MISQKKNTIRGVHFQIIQCVPSNRDLKLSYRFTDFKQDKSPPGRGRKINLNHPAKGKRIDGIECLACWSVVDMGNICQGVTSST